jgi:hypothetical protein
LRYLVDIGVDIPTGDLDGPRLLIKALRELPEDEAATMLAYLIDRSLVSPAAASRSACRDEPASWGEIGGQSPRSQDAMRLRLTGAPSPHVGYSTRGPLRMMPVRLPEEHYRRLKEWSEAHSFPMAVVVRGLVERFLDDQQDRRPDQG